MKICIIDDSVSTRSLLATLVNTKTKIKHDILEFEAAEEAVRSYTSGTPLPDVILVDVGLPGMSGYDFCKKFRADICSNESRPYIIVITGNDDSESVAKAIESGANDYISKPVNAKVLQTRLKVAQRIIEQASFSETMEYYRALSYYSLFYCHAGLAVTEPDIEWKPFSVLFCNEELGKLTNTHTTRITHNSLSSIQQWSETCLKAVRESIKSSGRFVGSVKVTPRDEEARTVQTIILPVGEAYSSPSNYVIIQIS